MSDQKEEYGLSVDDVRALLEQKHHTGVSPDDPLLMVVTILNAFLGEQNRLQERHKKVLSEFMNEKTGEYIRGVEESTEKLSKSISGVTIEGINKAVGEMKEILSTHRTSMFYCSAITFLAALLIVGVFVLK